MKTTNTRGTPSLMYRTRTDKSRHLFEFQFCTWIRRKKLTQGRISSHYMHARADLCAVLTALNAGFLQSRLFSFFVVQLAEFNTVSFTGWRKNKLATTGRKGAIYFSIMISHGSEATCSAWGGMLSDEFIEISKPSAIVKRLKISHRLTKRSDAFLTHKG